MFTSQDLDEAGALSADAAASLRSFVGTHGATPSVDEEQFRLVNSFNDEALRQRLPLLDRPSLQPAA